MYISVAERFDRTKNNDLYITFIPILLVFGLRSILKGHVSDTAFLILQIALAIALAVWLVLICHFYFRAFRYTAVDDDSARLYPVNSLTFERLMNEKARIYERVMADEMLCLLAPAERYDEARYGVAEKPYVLTAPSQDTAMRLYYRQGGKVYCAKFHPNEEQIEVLNSWIGAHNP